MQPYASRSQVFGSSDQAVTMAIKEEAQVRELQISPKQVGVLLAACELALVSYW